MESDNGYITTTVPPGENGPPEVERRVIEQESDTPITEVLASTGMDVIAFTGLGIGLLLAGIVLRWNARKLGRTHRPAPVTTEA